MTLGETWEQYRERITELDVTLEIYLLKTCCAVATESRVLLRISVFMRKTVEYKSASSNLLITRGLWEASK